MFATYIRIWRLALLVAIIASSLQFSSQIGYAEPDGGRGFWWRGGDNVAYRVNKACLDHIELEYYGNPTEETEGINGTVSRMQNSSQVYDDSYDYTYSYIIEGGGSGDGYNYVIQLQSLTEPLGTAERWEFSHKWDGLIHLHNNPSLSTQAGDRVRISLENVNGMVTQDVIVTLENCCIDTGSWLCPNNLRNHPRVRITSSYMYEHIVDNTASSTSVPENTRPNACEEDTLIAEYKLDVDDNFRMQDLNVALHAESTAYFRDLYLQLTSPGITSRTETIWSDANVNSFLRRSRFGSRCHTELRGDPMADFVLDDDSAFDPYNLRTTDTYAAHRSLPLRNFEGEYSGGTWTLSVCSTEPVTPADFNLECLNFDMEEQPSRSYRHTIRRLNHITSQLSPHQHRIVVRWQTDKPTNQRLYYQKDGGEWVRFEAYDYDTAHTFSFKVPAGHVYRYYVTSGDEFGTYGWSAIQEVDLRYQTFLPTTVR